ncbi:Uncharacterised protein [Candidatus Anstonella stagnisolia]|nr:Uncharacterised protein [Candidatus Anstonella stagnisolia]
MRANIPNPCQTRSFLKQQQRGELLPTNSRHVFRRNGFVGPDEIYDAALHTARASAAKASLKVLIGERIGQHIGNLRDIICESCSGSDSAAVTINLLTDLSGGFQTALSEAIPDVKHQIVEVLPSPVKTREEVTWRLSQLAELNEKLPLSRQQGKIRGLISEISHNFDEMLKIAVPHVAEIKL